MQVVHAWHPEHGDAALRAALAEHDRGHTALQAVADALPDATVLVALAGAVDHGPPATTADAAGVLQRPVLLDAGDGSAVLPVFTHLAALRRWRERARFIALPGRRLLELATAHGMPAVAVDPAGPHPVLLEPTEPPGVDAPAVRDPRFGLAALPGPLSDTDITVLRQAVAAELALAAAWAVELVDPAGGVHLVVALAPADGDADRAALRVADRLRERLSAPEHDLLDVVVLHDTDLRAAVTALDDPVYPAPPRPQPAFIRPRP